MTESELVRSRLPFKPTNERISFRRSETSDSDRKGLKVAIVEDEDHLRSLYSLTLRNRGFEVLISAHCGEQMLSAMDESKARNVDVAIVDYRLGKGMNGLDIAKLILEANSRVRIIIATADDSITKEAKAAGYSILIKPFSIQQLFECVSEQLNCKVLS